MNRIPSFDSERSTWRGESARTAISARISAIAAAPAIQPQPSVLPSWAPAPANSRISSQPGNAGGSRRNTDLCSGETPAPATSRTFGTVTASAAPSVRLGISLCIADDRRVSRDRERVRGRTRIGRLGDFFEFCDLPTQTLRYQYFQVCNMGLRLVE